MSHKTATYLVKHRISGSNITRNGTLYQADTSQVKYLILITQQAKNIGPTWALNGYLYGSYMDNP